MPRDFIPRRDADFLQFTSNFAAKISPPTDPATLGLTATQVAHYATTQQTFATAFQLASQPDSRTVVAVRRKNQQRIVLENETRMLAAIIRAFLRHSDTRNITFRQLGMCVPAQRRQRVATPATAPRLRIRSESSRQLRVLLGDVDSLRLRKPRDAWGAIIFAFVGDQPPASMEHGSGWRCVKAVTRTRTTVNVSAEHTPGTKIWLKACWTNWRGQRGPMCMPVFTHIPFSGPVMSREAEVTGVDAAPIHAAQRAAA